MVQVMSDSDSKRNHDIGNIIMVGVTIAIICGISLYTINFIYGLSIFDLLLLTLKIPIWGVLLFISSVILLIMITFFAIRIRGIISQVSGEDIILELIGNGVICIMRIDIFHICLSQFVRNVSVKCLRSLH